jgi:hypothetical protein
MACAGPPLLQRRVDRCELGIELGANALNRGDDRECNTAGDQAIFDRGGAALIVQEFRNQLLHSKLLSGRTPEFSHADACGEIYFGRISGLLTNTLNGRLRRGPVFLPDRRFHIGRDGAWRCKTRCLSLPEEPARTLYRSVDSCSNYALQAEPDIGRLGEESA